MVDMDAREVLREENRLLEKLAEQASGAASRTSGVSAQILSGWSGSFHAYKKRNDELISANKEVFDRNLEEEEVVLKVLVEAIQGQKGEIADSWRAMFGEELEILTKLR